MLWIKLLSQRTSGFIIYASPLPSPPPTSLVPPLPELTMDMRSVSLFNYLIIFSKISILPHIYERYRTHLIQFRYITFLSKFFLKSENAFCEFIMEILNILWRILRWINNIENLVSNFFYFISMNINHICLRDTFLIALYFYSLFFLNIMFSMINLQ